MRKFKIGDKVRIVKPLCVRKRDGRIENFKDRVVEVRTVEFSSCCCDLGLSRLVYIPVTHLQKVA